MGISPLVTLGFGAFGGAELLPTLGFLAGAPVIPPEPPIEPPVEPPTSSGSGWGGAGGGRAGMGSGRWKIFDELRSQQEEEELIALGIL